jgi:DUF4097 and DUF4098 domain-containing protein YvlB
MNQPGDNVIGKVTSVSKDTLVVSPMMGGDPVTIKVGDNTRVMKDRQPVKVEDIKVDDVANRLDIGTLSGDVEAHRVNGDVQIKSVSGDIRLSDFKGDFEGETVSGSIELRNATGRYIRSHTTSGDLAYEGSIDPSGRYELSAHSGDIRLDIPSNTSAQLSVSTWSGTLDSDFPITLRPGEHGIGAGQAKRFTFDIGGGAARISAETFSGDITIGSRGSSRR